MTAVSTLLDEIIEDIAELEAALVSAGAASGTGAPGYSTWVSMSIRDIKEMLYRIEATIGV